MTVFFLSPRVRAKAMHRRIKPSKCEPLIPTTLLADNMDCGQFVMLLSGQADQPRNPTSNPVDSRALALA